MFVLSGGLLLFLTFFLLIPYMFIGDRQLLRISSDRWVFWNGIKVFQKIYIWTNFFIILINIFGIVKTRNLLQNCLIRVFFIYILKFTSNITMICLRLKHIVYKYFLMNVICFASLIKGINNRKCWNVNFIQKRVKMVKINKSHWKGIHTFLIRILRLVFSTKLAMVVWNLV